MNIAPVSVASSAFDASEMNELPPDVLESCTFDYCLPIRLSFVACHPS